MGVKVITAASNILTLAQLRLHLRLVGDPHPEDSLLLSYLASAVQFAEHYTGRSIGEQTLELALDAFPAGPIELKQGPALSIVSIKYLDVAGVEQTLSPSAYTLDDYGLQNWALCATDWPASGEFANAVKVRYQAGSLPPCMENFLILSVCDSFENRSYRKPSKGACELLDTVMTYA